MRTSEWREAEKGRFRLFFLGNGVSLGRMANRVSGLLRAYRERSEAEKTLWEFVREKDPYLFSHHPPGKGFREHVWKFRGLYFCKGCVVTFAGAVVGGMFFGLTRWLDRLEPSEAAVLFSFLLAPTVIAHGLGLPRGFRHVARFLLGFLMISAFLMLFVTDSWFVRLAIVVVYFAAKIPLGRRRERENRRLAGLGGDQSSGE